MHRQPHIRERILDFSAIIKTEASYQLVSQSPPPKSLLKRARLKIGAVFDGTRLRGIIADDAFQFAGHEFRFGLRVARFVITKVRSFAILGPKDLAQAFGIISNYRASGVQDLLRGAI